MTDGTTVVPTAFDRAIAVSPAGDGAFAARIDPGWSAPVGPNGGYVAALVLQAMLAGLDDPFRAPRSLTLHYLRAPQEGAEVRIGVAVARTGRSLSTLSARLVQGERACVVALGAFAPDYPTAGDYATPAPAAPPADEVAPGPVHPLAPPIGARVQMRPVFGAPLFSGADEGLTGGWVSLVEPRPVDAPALALYCDVWWPAPWPRLRALAPAPTIDLTIHFRSRPAAGLVAPLLARFSSRTSAGGFFEEDGEVWSPDGTLLAQSRQLALLRPGSIDL